MSDYNSNYMFNNMSRLGNDESDISQKTVYNTRFSNYMLSNYFSDNQSNPVTFSTNQPAVMLNGSWGIPAASVDMDSKLIMGGELERPWDKLELTPRIFSTVPYLGRGSCDPTLENMIRCGETTIDRKSVSTVSETSYSGHDFYPGDGLDKEPNESSALGFEWGGIDSRSVFLGNNTRPGGAR